MIARFLMLQLVTIVILSGCSYKPENSIPDSAIRVTPAVSKATAGSKSPGTEVIPIREPFFSVGFYKNTWYACNGTDTLYTSTDGLDWKPSVTLGYSIYSLFCVNNQLIAPTHTGDLYRSDNGTTWEKSSEAGYFLSLDYFKDMYIGVDAFGQISTSTDAIRWIKKEFLHIRTPNIIVRPDYAVVYGQSYSKEGWSDYRPCSWVVGDTNGIRPSEDYLFERIAYNGEIYMAVAKDNIRETSPSTTTGDNCIAISIDGLSWDTAVHTDVVLTDMLFDGQRFVALGNKKIYLIDQRGSHWEIHEIDTLDSNFRRIVCMDGKYYVYHIVV